MWPRLRRGGGRRRDRPAPGRRAGDVPARRALQQSRRRRARRGASGRRRVVTPALVSVWLHLLGVVTWMGGLMYQAHVLVPAARRRGAAPLAEALPRGRRVTWIATAVVAPTGCPHA